MADNPGCPSLKFVCVTICSQGAECITCQFYSKREQQARNGQVFSYQQMGEDAGKATFTPDVWMKTAKQSKQAPGAVAEMGNLLVYDEPRTVESLYVPAIYFEEVTGDGTVEGRKPEALQRSDHAPHTLVYCDVWREEWT